MTSIAPTPDPPYTAVIFTAVPSEDSEGYDDTAERMNAIVRDQPGFLAVEHASGPPEITVSYWATDADARAWKAVAEHRAAQEEGQQRWYADYRVRVARVERDYGPSSSDSSTSRSSAAAARPSSIEATAISTPSSMESTAPPT